jgi:hypothetical protein
MSKKLIAVASAAALAITAFVGAPAFAAPATTITGAASGAGTSTDPYVETVPATNTIASGTNAVTITVSGLATGDVVRIDTTGTVKMVTSLTPYGTATTAIDLSTVGVQTYSKTTTNTSDVVVYAFNTSTTAGTIVTTTTRTGLTASSTQYFKGSTDAEYNITEVSGVPATLANTKTAAITFRVTDVFGNQVKNNADVLALTPTGVSGLDWDATSEKYEAVMTSSSDNPYVLTIDLGVTDTVGMAKAKDSFVAVINNTGVAAQITALTAQITALTADYNALAAKWNKRVASKTAPKKKVALK